ncbi:hypothetical protein [Georgenia faecalis]|uniref:Uncharacterized protein n=1 Tax=Georgenia faecalis TaxID=2483799 RepID=A0ABV9D6T0_9MICO|nr:hypothetical protein [Georgenia faecalis]
MPIARARRDPDGARGRAGRGPVPHSEVPGPPPRAVGLHPGSVGPDLALLTGAGNRALAGLVAVSRQVDVVAEEAPVQEAPRLDAAAVADARRYYTSQPWLYTPAILTQLREALGLAAAGGADDALVLAVADWQAADGAGDPALAVDGKAGPRTLPRIFASGLNSDGEGEAFGEEVQTDVVDEWAALASPAARRDRLVERVNARLAAAGVPAVTPAADASGVSAGAFDFPTWRMLIGDAALGGASIAADAARNVADTVYHEARHAEQWFRMAQLRAGQGLTARAIATELGIPARIAAAARAAPLPRGTMPAVVAQGWWDSVYGARSEERGRVLTEATAAAAARNAARAAFDADPSEANRVALEAAQARFDPAFEAYRNLPEENDAWATAPAAGAGITRGSPAPPTIDEAAGSPPAAGGGPAHGVLPEEDLP